MSIRMSCRMLVFTALAMVGVAPLAAQELRVGTVSFPNSGAPEAQEDFLFGVAQLHNFQYQSGAAAFRRAQETDPDFALAYWGEAMTYNHPVWMEQDREAALAVLQRLGATPEARLAKAPTERERDLLAALEVLYGEGDKQDRDDAFARFMEGLHDKYPDDLEIASFTSLAILETAHEGRDFSTYMRVAAIAEEVFDTDPNHPGAAHYLILVDTDDFESPTAGLSVNQHPGQVQERMTVTWVHGLAAARRGDATAVGDAPDGPLRGPQVIAGPLTGG